MITSYKIETSRFVFENLPQVKSVDQINIANGFIQTIVLNIKYIGETVIHNVDMGSERALFEFYTRGLSEKSRSLFYPYPLFNPRPISVEDLATRINDWKKENDWVMFCLYKGKQIIGVVFIKKMGTGLPTTGLAIRDKYQNKGLGHLLQQIVIEQARLLKVKMIYITVLPDNLASIRVHEKCGFKQEGMVTYLKCINGVKEEIPVLKMVVDLTSSHL